VPRHRGGGAKGAPHCNLVQVRDANSGESVSGVNHVSTLGKVAEAWCTGDAVQDGDMLPIPPPVQTCDWHNFTQLWGGGEESRVN
jgi:hypothetical protein